MNNVIVPAAIALLVLIAGLAILIATRSSFMHIERTANVGAPPDAVFAIVNDLRRWGEWSPYEKLDPDMKKTIEGAGAGVGTVYTWNGNKRAGEGRMTVLESQPGRLVRMKLEFTRPFASTNQVDFTLVPSEGGTRVTWSIEGKNSFMGKAMSLIMDMDKMVGKDFEAGLASLDTVARAGLQASR